VYGRYPSLLLVVEVQQPGDATEHGCKAAGLLHEGYTPRGPGWCLIRGNNAN
jgi:hypothetical protein